jgi:hypothetical protein
MEASHPIDAWNEADMGKVTSLGTLPMEQIAPTPHLELVSPPIKHHNPFIILQMSKRSQRKISALHQPPTM